MAARNEFDPTGPIEYKRVEAKFIRTGRILEVVVNGRDIGTTLEHPFDRKDSGWVPASVLHTGDEVRTKDGWVAIDEIRDIGVYETVYNIRVAEHHTYFIGDQHWGFAVWEHNALCGGELSLDDLKVLKNRVVDGKKIVTVHLAPK